MPSSQDTIAAISTPPGDGGISIIRVSGEAALDIADKIFLCAGACPSLRASNTFAHGRIAAPGRAAGAPVEASLDEVILLIYRAPHSYTREDVVEIQGHGGAVCARRILRAVLDAGARQAEPGEFTQRAFLNGRIDLVQAEAVLDLIRARSDRAAQAAMEQLNGFISMLFNGIYDDLIALDADLESTLDFSEEELPASVMPNLKERAVSLSQRLTQALETWGEGRLLREGALVVISGKPNAGKSTLLNRMLQFDRAIVSPIPGTTRDTIEESMVLDGIPLRLVDTAGLRAAACEVEREGIERARAYVEKADILITVLDGSVPPAPDELDALARIDVARSILLVNKADLGLAWDPSVLPPQARRIVCSLLAEGFPEELREALQAKLHLNSSVDHHAAISERHRQLLMQTQQHVEEAKALLDSGQDEQVILAASSLQNASEILGQATGRIYHDELLTSIFSRFCVGK